ncbi:MAG: SDR family oxidoreductase [Deltaproteobacteria bacterium]|nr:SDR family oxidoreductase [Deltaproteobacteria bacterium]
MQRSYLITGGAGFIGSNIAATLLKNGERVRILDNFSSGKKENLILAPEPAGSSLEIIEGDIRDPEICRRAVRGADYVLHHAALISVPQSTKNPALANDINITGTLNMLLAARDEGVRRFILASSCAVYGDGTSDVSGPIDETSFAPVNEAMKPRPLSPYALGKLAGEEYCRIFYELYGLETIALRYFNVFGPKQDPASEYAAVIPKFIIALLSGKSPIIFGDGEQTRDFIYVDDVVRANLLACKTSGAAAGKTFNVACGKRVTVNALLNELKAILDIDLIPVFKDARSGDIRHSWANITLAQKLLGFEPGCSLRDALSQTANWAKKTIASEV